MGEDNKISSIDEKYNFLLDLKLRLYIIVAFF